MKRQAADPWLPSIKATLSASNDMTLGETRRQKDCIQFNLSVRTMPVTVLSSQASGYFQDPLTSDSQASASVASLISGLNCHLGKMLPLYAYDRPTSV